MEEFPLVIAGVYRNIFVGFEFPKNSGHNFHTCFLLSDFVIIRHEQQN